MKLAEDGSTSSISTSAVVGNEGIGVGVVDGTIEGNGICKGLALGVWVETGKGKGLNEGKGKGLKKVIAIGTASKLVNISLGQFKLI